jgi:hypothetical protein
VDKKLADPTADPPVESTDDITGTDTFMVEFDITDYKPLFLADIRTTAPSASRTLTLAKAPTVRLYPHHVNDDTFIPVALVEKVEDTNKRRLKGESITGDNDPDKGKEYLTYTINSSIDANFTDSRLAFANDPAGTPPEGAQTYLPNRDTDTLLAFTLQYTAFGTSKSLGTTWTIKNGLYDTPDDVTSADSLSDTGSAGAGSYIPVIFGKGTPPHLIDKGAKVSKGTP